jgi:plastocyanin
MTNGKESGRHPAYNFVWALAFSLAAIATLAAARAQAAGSPAPSASNDSKPLEVKIASTEFKFVPATVRVPAGRPVTLILDNSGGETEHGIVLSALGFRMEVNAGGIARKTIVFDKPGEYEFSCDLPGHREAGMKGTLIVGAF